MSVGKTGEHVTASKALFILVATASWTFLPSPGAVKLAMAATTSATTDVECLEETDACTADSTCMTCSRNTEVGDLDASITVDCLEQYTGGSPSDGCLTLGAGICCSQLLSDMSCASNAEVEALIACVMEIEDCSIDDVLCLEDESDELASGSTSFVSEGPLSMVKVVFAGSLGLLITIAALL